MELKGKLCPYLKTQCKLKHCAAYYKETVFWTEGKPPTKEDCCRILKPKE